MSLKAFAVASLAIVSLVGVTGAARASERNAFSATLAAPVGGDAGRIFANGIDWSCAETSCRAWGYERPTVNGCRELTKKVGAVSAYGAKDRQLSDKDLAKCNVGLAVTAEAPKTEPAD